MTLKYKDLEALAARQSEVWAPDGTPNLYAVDFHSEVSRVFHREVSHL
jgi:hypothetical protein